MNNKTFLAGFLSLALIMGTTGKAHAWFYYVSSSTGHPFFATSNSSWSNYWDCFELAVGIRWKQSSNCTTIPTWEVPLPFYHSNSGSTRNIYGYIRQQPNNFFETTNIVYKLQTYSGSSVNGAIPYQSTNKLVLPTSQVEQYVGTAVVPVSGYAFMICNLPNGSVTEFVGVSWNPDYDQ